MKKYESYEILTKDGKFLGRHYDLKLAVTAFSNLMELGLNPAELVHRVVEERVILSLPDC